MSDRIPRTTPRADPQPPSSSLLASETAEVTGPRRLPSGRAEQLFGVVRRDEVVSGPLPSSDAAAPSGALQAFHPAHWRPGEFARGLDGRPTAAAATVLVDNATAVAVHHAGQGSLGAVVTTELQINILRPLPPLPDPADPDGAAPVLDCWYSPLSLDELGGAGRAWLLDDAGRVVVEATGWFQAVPSAEPASLAAFVANSELPVGPEQRRPMAELLGLDPDSVLPARADERPEVTGEARPLARFEACEQLANPQGATHGGVMTLRAVVAAQGALPDRAGYTVQAIRSVFLRPGRGPMVAMTRVRHAGRSLRLVDVDLVPLDDAGRPIAAKPMLHAEITFRAAVGD